jgi:hypothetical protein
VYSPERLDTHDLNDNPLRSSAIELGIENLLPWSEIEPTIGYRQDHLVVQNQVL